MLDRILDAIALVSARYPLPGTRLGRYAVPLSEADGETPFEDAARDYLSWLLERFGGDPRAALAAYHSGPSIRSLWVQLREWDVMRCVLAPEAVRFVEEVMREVERNGKRR